MIQTSFHYSVKDREGTSEIRTKFVQPFGGNIYRNFSDTPIAIQFNEVGIDFYVYRQISAGDDRQFDNQFILIHIPGNEIIETKDLCFLLEQVKLLITKDIPIEEQAAFAEDVSRLGQQFESKTQILPKFISDDGGKLAYRYYNGDYTLKELLEKIYQPIYQRYRAVILLDKKGKLQGTEQMDDLSERALSDINILDPKAIQLSAGIKPYFEGKEFNKPVFYEKLPLNFELRKEGCVSQTVQYGKGGLSIGQWKMRVTPDVVRVIKDDGNTSHNFLLKVNGKYINSTVEIAEEELKDASFSIEKQGYEPNPFVKEHINLAKLICEGRPFEVRLDKGAEVFYIRTKDYGKATLTVKSPKHINDDPIEGYYREYDNSDELKYDSWSFLNHWFFRLLMAGALILGGVGGYLVSGWINSRSAKQNTTVTTQTTPNQNGENVQQLSPSDGGASTGAAETVTAPEKPAQNEAVEYLDNNDVWNKDKMDQIAELKGFWDLVNDYDINKIKEQPWKDRLSESKTYNEIINTFGNKKTSDFRTNRPHNKRTDDYDINVKRYIKAIKGYSGNSNAQPQEGSSTPKKEHPTTTTTNSTNNQSTNQSAGTNEENL